MLLEDKKIIWCLKSDIVLYWVHNLTQNKIIYSETESCEIYYSSLYDVYFYYYKGDDSDELNITNNLVSLSSKYKNDVHVLICDFRCVDIVLKTIDVMERIKYSIVNHMGEMIYDYQPRKINELHNIKYYFSCSDLYNDKGTKSNFQQTKKFIKDYKYSLTYFYFKLGINFIQLGDHTINPKNRKNKFFLYTKSKENSQRKELIDMLIDSGKVEQKEFNNSENFWFKYNNTTHHTSFIIDYNICKFNLVMETQPLEKHSHTLSNFCTEKTLKSLMVPTPSYIVMQKDVYYELKKYGFYFLNEEFGDYDFENYTKFCNFLNICTETDLDHLFSKSSRFSVHNKLKIEEYIYSDKQYEIKLLTNKD